MDTEVFNQDVKYTVMEVDNLIPEVVLSAFLYVGKPSFHYHLGNMFVHNYFIPPNLYCIKELAMHETKKLMPVEIIIKAFESNLVPHLETLIFALAVCCKQRYCEELSHAAYTAVGKICSKPEHFILFIKFVSQISKQRDALVCYGKASHGWGHGLRKAVNNWYLSKEPLELAKCVTRCKSRYGWKHKDIVKLSHPHPDTPEKEVILKYIMYGLEETKKSFGNNLDVKELIDYIQKVENFKHCKDEDEAAGLLEEYKFTLDHVPGHMLKSKKVWNSLIPSMDLHTLLNNLQRINNLELLKPNDPAVEKIIDEITNKEKLSHDNIHPIFIYITLQNYKNSGKPLSYEKRKMRMEAKKPFPLPPAPNTKIINALQDAFNLSIMNLKPTGLRYMITINDSKRMWQTPTWHSGNVIGAEAAFLIAYILSCYEKNVTVAAFDTVDLRIISLNQLPHFPIMKEYQPTGNKAIHLNTPILWALDKLNEYDVFINITDCIKEDLSVCSRDFALYRDKMNLPHAKLINCAVCSCSKGNESSIFEKNILAINGFDETVPTVIEAFSKSLF